MILIPCVCVWVRQLKTTVMVGKDRWNCLWGNHLGGPMPKSCPGEDGRAHFAFVLLCASQDHKRRMPLPMQWLMNSPAEYTACPAMLMALTWWELADVVGYTYKHTCSLHVITTFDVSLEYNKQQINWLLLSQSCSPLLRFILLGAASPQLSQETEQRCTAHCRKDQHSVKRKDTLSQNSLSGLQPAMCLLLPHCWQRGRPEAGCQPKRYSGGLPEEIFRLATRNHLSTPCLISFTEEQWSAYG